MAALALGSSVLGALHNVLFDRMASRDFMNLFRERKPYRRLLEKLKMKLLVIKVVLDDAENKEIRNPDVKEWLHQVHDAVYGVDDLLDLINTEALRVKVEREYQSSSSNTQVSSSSLNSPQFSNEFLDEMMPKIEEMLEMLDDFEAQIRVLGLEKQKGESKSQPSRLPSTSLVDDTAVYGRDAEKENIIQILLSGSDDAEPIGENITVISIVGLGGIGKTTLAQLVYNDERVKSKFDTRAWVCISEAYDAVRITKDLLGELSISCSADNFNSLQTQLQKGLAEKKILLVLDDVWNKNYEDWETLTRPFSVGKQGSKIIVTTRDESIARMINNGPIHHLDFMSEKDCLSLFEKLAFGSRDVIAKSELEEIGKDIVKKCNGLPLAVKALGGLLRSKSTKREWEDILKSDVWDLRENPILPALRLSYNHLPSDLKRYFTYCSVFPKDYEFTKHQVILLWIANDLLKCPKNSNRLEDVGDEFIQELRWRSLFQQSSGGKFSMHDLVNDLARCTAPKYSINVDGYVGRDTISRAHHKLDVVRHFSYLSNDHDTFDNFKPLNEAKCLRTYFPIGRRYRIITKMISTKFLHDILPTFRSLRVLSLSYYYNITELPDSFGNLKQLRFLDLSFTSIGKLPDWICSLYHLQTLLLNGCRKLRELPTDMGKIINLRHLDFTGVPLTEMPVQIGQLKNLQFLSTFIASKGTRIRELGNLCNLSGKLTISGLQTVADCRDALMAKMKDKEHIKELRLRWSGGTNDSHAVRQVLDNLRPHPNTVHIRIEGYGGTSFPEWVGDSSFGNIKSLRLEKFENCISLPSLGQLPCLEVLEIFGMSQISELGKEIYENCSVSIKPFRSLKVLRIEKMEVLKEWHVPTENGVFSDLEELRIIDCPKFVGEIPKQLPLLRKLEVSGCSGLVTIFQSQAENGVLSCLEELCIIDCPKLIGEFPKELPSLIKLKVKGCSGLVTPVGGGISIFESQEDVFEGYWSSLQDLEISRMESLKEFSSDYFKNKFSSLRWLVIRHCKNMVFLPMNGLPDALKRLEIEECQNLQLFQTSSGVLIEELSITNSVKDEDVPLGLFPKLQTLDINECRNLRQVVSIPPGGGHDMSFTSLRSLSVWNCENLMSFAEGGLPAPNLNTLSIRDCRNVKSLPERMHTLLPSLRDLEISNCPEIESFPEGGLPSLLQSLYIFRCKKLWGRRREWGLHKLPSLLDLSISGNYQLEEEDWACNLREFRVGYNDNLRTLSLQHLTSLQSLYINNCSNLQSVAEEGLPASLSLLRITNCPKLKPRLEWEKGEDWP